MRFLHRDHQGSVVEVTDGSQNPVHSLAYDAWGLRRNPTTWAPLGSPFGGVQPTEQGYTGQEHLDSVELIHMNGRVQDPRLGRFLSGDPVVQAPYSGQSANRYSYVANVPTTYVDPTGFTFNPNWEGLSYIDIDTLMAMDSNYRSPTFNGHGFDMDLIGTSWCCGVASLPVAPPIEPPPTTTPPVAVPPVEIPPIPIVPETPPLPSATPIEPSLPAVDLARGIDDVRFDPNTMTFGTGEPVMAECGACIVQRQAQEAFLKGEIDAAELTDLYSAHADGALAGLSVYPLGGAGWLYRASGGAKQWIRIGPSFNRATGGSTKLSVRWGASPRHAEKIPNEALRQLNQKLRTKRIPGTSDPGHLHIWE